jgi:polyhydroxyalkanoate synthase
MEEAIMAKQPGPEVQPADPAEMARAMAKIAERSQRLVAGFLERQQHDDGPANLDPLNIGGAFMEMTAQMMADPAKMVQAQIGLWQDYMKLWQSTTRRMLGEEAEPVIEPEPGDRRFKHADWDESYLFDYVKQSYLLTARWMQSTVHDVEGLDDKTAQKVDFYTRQFADALAPSNFVMTNPEVLRATVESGGENLVKGLENLLDDLERGKGRLAIKMTDSEAFDLGHNIAITPGKVVYQTDLMQLIQYEPSTEKVHKRPLLIMPPWINKYYILDLREKNSFVKWAVAEGFTVFVVSWVNPDRELARKSFEDYMIEGPLAALEAIEKATGEKQANVIGYCLGGTLLSVTLAYMKAKGDARIASATFLTALTDFEEPGELGVFVDEEQLAGLERQMAKKGYLEGAHMATTFNMLRANDLIWSFVVNNYLLGKDPFPFDLLYWNSDSTRLPAAMHSYYLRNMYQENLLVKPGGLTFDGVAIDLTTIETPAFMLSAKEDHIAPWASTYAATQLFSGPVKFVLAASGHIAGVVNPPAAGKYSHWTNPKNPKDPKAWLAGAKEHPGSWWPTWSKWAAKYGGGKVAARVPGDRKLKVIEDAPGSYVAVRDQD